MCFLVFRILAVLIQIDCHLSWLIEFLVAKRDKATCGIRLLTSDWCSREAPGMLVGFLKDSLVAYCSRDTFRLPTHISSAPSH